MTTTFYCKGCTAESTAAVITGGIPMGLDHRHEWVPMPVQGQGKFQHFNCIWVCLFAVL